MPTCRETSELVTDYLERALPLRTWAGVRCHLVVCRACRAYFAQMRATVGLLVRLPRRPPPAAVEADLLASLGGGDGDKPG